jgi:hypothetical protein
LQKLEQGERPPPPVTSSGWPEPMRPVLSQLP